MPVSFPFVLAVALKFDSLVDKCKSDFQRQIHVLQI